MKLDEVGKDTWWGSCCAIDCSYCIIIVFI